VSNPEGVSSGVKTLLLNGSKLEGTLVPLCEPGSTNRVEVVLGS
jgi:cellobiose phosphorylase